MNIRKLNQSGFEAVAVIVIVLVLAVLGAGTYLFMQRQNQAKTPAVTSVKAPANTLADNAKTLDSDSAAADSSLNDSSLDADLNAVF